MKPRVLVLADTEFWAWAKKARAYRQYLSDAFDITVAYHANVPSFADFDLIHLFEVSQVGHLTAYGPRAQRPFKAIAGLTAHVWRTWGAARMHAWAEQVDALHGNSLLLVNELEPFHDKVYYTPNGVDAATYQRREPRDPSAPIIFGHVGKPNPRKGGDVIVNAARTAGVELRLIQRTSKLALSEAEMIDWYQGIDVMVCASNMDGTPNTLLEGAACECALLSTPIGNMPEFVKQMENGWLLEHRLPCEPPHTYWEEEEGWSANDRLRERDFLLNELTECMAEWKSQPYTVRGMGRAARQTILDGWTWAQQVGHVRTMWQEVLNGP